MSGEVLWAVDIEAVVNPAQCVALRERGGIYAVIVPGLHGKPLFFQLLKRDKAVIMQGVAVFQLVDGEAVRFGLSRRCRLRGLHHRRGLLPVLGDLLVFFINGSNKSCRRVANGSQRRL